MGKKYKLRKKLKPSTILRSRPACDTMSSSPQHTGAEPKPEGTATDQSLSQCYESKPCAPPHIRFSLYEIVLENLDPSIITLDTLMVYFRSEASCGGTLDEDRCSFDEDTGEAIITFIDADVTHRVLRRKEHMVGSMNVTIKAGKEQPIRVQNKYCLVIYKQHEIDKEDLTLLIKAKWNLTFPGRKIPGFDMKFNADDSAALVTFTQPVHNMAELIEKLSGKLLGGEVSAKLVNRTHSIMVENLPPKIDNDYLSLLFDSLECPAYRVEQVKHDGTAIVHLKATEYVDSICDLARRGELQLKKAALTCWPFLPEFHSVISGNAHHQTVVSQHNTQLSFPVHTGPISSIEIEGAFQVKFFFRPKLVVIAYKANLLRAKVDVIVSPANTTLTAEGGIAQKLAEAAGPRYVNGCKNYIARKGPLTLGDTMNALSGNLPKPIRGVVHAICQPTNDLSQAQIEAMLQEVVFKSLKMADEQSEAAIVALPSVWDTINTPELVAECLLKAICKFNEHTLSCKRSSNLKEIHITNLTKEMNEQMITLMTHGIHKLSPPEEFPLLLRTKGLRKTRVTMATPPSSPPVKITQSATGHIMRLMANDRLRVEIYQANLVKQKTDAIVNPANSRLQHDAGAARAIAEAAGPLLVQECTDYIRRYKEVPVTETTHTTAGNLRPGVKTVIHVVGPFWNEQQQHQSFQEIRDTFLNTLVCANKLQCRSVSIPAISSGIFGVPLDVVGQAAFCAIIRYEEIQQPPHYLREVHLVNIDEPTTMSLKKTFETAVKKQFDENGRATVTMVMIDDDPVKGKVTEPPLHILQSAQGPNALIGRAVGQMDTAQPDKEITPQVKSHKSSGTRVRTVQDSSHEVPHTGATQASQLWMKTSEDVDLYIHQGSIENQSTEAIVNVTSMSVLRKEGVSKHILAKAGGEVEEELIKFIKANGNPKEGQCIHTSAGGGGGLPQVFYIIHVVAPSIDTASMDKLVNTLINILSYANTKLKASSIALPFFVTDNKENEEKLCKACIDGVLYYSRSLPANNRHLLKVHLVHPKVSTVMTMRSFFKTNAVNQMLITGTGMQLIQDSLSENGTSSRSTSAMNTTSPAQDREVKLHRTPESRMAKWMHLQTDEGLSVLVRHANIVEFEADAVVCMVDQNATIMTAAGKGMRQEYDDFFKLHAPLQDREVVRTSAGNMTPRVKHILHVKCPDYQPGCDSVRSLREAFYQCLTSANDHHAASISLPPLGVDTHGFTVMDTATAAYGAILAFSYGIRNKSTRCINLLHTDSTIMDEIQTAFRQLIEDQLNGKVRFCSQMFIKEEGDEFNNPPNPPPLLNEEARVIKRIEDQKRMHDLSWSETCSQPARRTRHRNSHMSLDTGLDSDISTQNKPVRLQSGGKPAIMPPLTAGNKRVSKTPQTHAPRNVPIRVIHKPDSPPLPLGSEKGSRSRDRQPREAEHVLASNRHQPVQRRRSSSMSRASTPSSDSGFCSTCGSSAKLVARTKCKHTWCEACRKKNSHCKAKACVKERK